MGCTELSRFDCVYTVHVITHCIAVLCRAHGTVLQVPRTGVPGRFSHVKNMNQGCCHSHVRFPVMGTSEKGRSYARRNTRHTVEARSSATCRHALGSHFHVRPRPPRGEQLVRPRERVRVGKRAFRAPRSLLDVRLIGPRDLRTAGAVGTRSWHFSGEGAC